MQFFAHFARYFFSMAARRAAAAPAAAAELHPALRRAWDEAAAVVREYRLYTRTTEEGRR